MIRANVSEVASMAEQDSVKTGKSSGPQPDQTDDKPSTDDFERFMAQVALTPAEKAALPARLRRMLGWEQS